MGVMSYKERGDMAEPMGKVRKSFARGGKAEREKVTQICPSLYVLRFG